ETGIADFHLFNASGVRMLATRKSDSRAAMEPRVINATGHPRSRWPSILARLAESSVVCRSRLAPEIVSSDNEDDRSMTRGVETGDIPSVCVAPVDSFILLTQRMKREVSEGSTRGGKAPARTWSTLKLDGPLDSEKFGFSKRNGH
ncbi:hypothetical protein ALC53_00590, partial [Atta colombica]